MSAARKKALTWSLVLVVLLVSIAVIQHVWALSLRSETTDNAQVEGDVVVISSEVSGRFLEVGVLDNQRVSAGQLLARIDSTDYQAHLTQADKALRSAQQREAAARAQLQLTQRQAQASLGEQESGVQLARAGVETASTGVESARQQLLQAQAGTQASRANLARSRTSVDLARAEQKRVDDDVVRYRALYAKDEVSRQQLDAIETQSRQARSRVEAARREVEAAQAQVDQARAAQGQASEAILTRQAQVAEAESRVGEAQSRLVSAQSAPEKIAVAVAQVRVARADVEQAQASLLLAREELERTKIVAPCAGVVSKRSAQVGAYAQKGSPLLSLVVQDHLWVVANFKETQLAKMRPGLKVEIKVDSYPGKIFAGHVESLQAGTGARFSLLPPENASGSYVKVVQRVPVKIVLDQASSEDTPLVPGMSVVARVLLL